MFIHLTVAKLLSSSYLTKKYIGNVPFAESSFCGALTSTPNILSISPSPSIAPNFPSISPSHPQASLPRARPAPNALRLFLSTLKRRTKCWNHGIKFSFTYNAKMCSSQLNRIIPTSLMGRSISFQPTPIANCCNSSSSGLRFHLYWLRDRR